MTCCNNHNYDAQLLQLQCVSSRYDDDLLHLIL